MKLSLGFDIPQNSRFFFKSREKKLESAERRNLEGT